MARTLISKLEEDNMKHPDLGSALVQLYPDADHLRDFRVEDRGDGEGPTLNPLGRNRS